MSRWTSCNSACSTSASGIDSLHFAKSIHRNAPGAEAARRPDRTRLSGALTVKTSNDILPHVVIIGAGFGGMETARRLRSAPVRVTLIDRLNYHTFQPLLYQVAIAGLIPSQIAYPVRTIFRHQKNVTFQMGEVTAIDFDARYVKLDGSVIAYDYLVLAVGGQTNFFGLGSVEQNAHQVKNIDA